MTARPAITIATLPATAHMTEPAQNTTMPASITHLRPNRSASEPPTSIRLANTSE
jgi:hypothetical protein